MSQSKIDTGPLSVYVLHEAPCCGGLHRIRLDTFRDVQKTEQFQRLIELGYTPFCPCFIAE